MEENRLLKLSLSVLLSAFAQEPEMVRVEGFWIGKTPVTNAQYKAFVDETRHPAPEKNSVGGSYRLWTNGSFPDEIAGHPVVNVSWKDALAYADWLSRKTGKTFRLPTEKEWEQAARGGLKGKTYPWGDGIDKTKAWYGAKWNGAETIKPAGYGEPNGFGLHGMAGNVWQWTSDWYVPYFNGRPVQEELEMFKVIRGGSWANEAEFLTVAYRNFHPPDFKDFFVGFRVVRD
ncbi:MAG: formylglycine-generating enzyme family protein [Acidobacteria bacterium]|nr:formylglycine-generating enzyme family protein [Acidobacteriota bacterium]